MLNVERGGDDAFGSALLDYHKSGDEILTRVVRVDDNTFEEMSTAHYFRTFDQWSPLDRALTQWIEGRTLDVGTGAGRLTLDLQEKGHDAVAIDVSQNAVEVVKARGGRDIRMHNIMEGPLENEKFRTIALLGANLGIAGLHENVQSFLETLKSMLEPGGRIIGVQINWERTDKQKHLDFQNANRKKVKHPVEMTLAIEYGDLRETFGWCLTNQNELKEIAGRIGLEPEAIVDCGSTYGYVLKLPEVEE